MKKYYNVYRIDKETNDIINVFGSEKREEIANYLQIRVDNLARHTTKTSEQMPKYTKVINDQHYIIILDNE